MFSGETKVLYMDEVAHVREGRCPGDRRCPGADVRRTKVLYTVNRKKRGSTFDIITLEKHARFS